MAKLLKLRRGTTSQHSSFTGAEGEVTVDTTKDTIVVHDGSTAGGIPLAKESAALSLIDEDNMSTNSATRPPSQQSVKAYVDTADALKANLAAPAFTGTATGVNLTLSGNLTVNGTTTTVATTNTTVKDNLLELNSGATSNANDSGILIERGSTGDNAIIAWDESADKFIVGTTTAANDATGDLTITTGTLVANIEGAVTGTASNATTAQNVAIADESSDTTCFPTFVASATGNLAHFTGSNLTFNSSTGNLTATIVSDSKGELRHVPRVTKTANYTLVAADAGKCITTTHQVTIPSSTLSLARNGEMVSIINHSGSDITIVSGSSLTMYNVADAATGDRTLAGRGMATIYFYNDSICYISGAGLS